MAGNSTDGAIDTGSTIAVLFVVTAEAGDERIDCAAFGDAGVGDGIACEILVVRVGRLLPVLSNENDFSAKLKTSYALVGGTVSTSVWLVTMIDTTVVVKIVSVNVMMLVGLPCGAFPPC